MAYNVTEDFRKVIYSGDADYDCRLYFDNLLVPVEQIQYIKISSPIIDTTSETGSMYHIGTFISQKLEIKFRNLYGLDLTNNPNIYLEIGLKVNDNYEYVPIGYYLIDELGENYQQTCTITCLDYAVKFRSQLDISQFLNADKYIYACDLFEAICRYYGVEVGTYPTTNNYKRVYQYDSDLSGKDYISFIAELFGGNAKIGRDGKCYIFALNGSIPREIEGDNFTVENSIESKATFNIEGKCEQEGTPTPSSPIPINTIGNNINILNFYNMTQSTTYGLEIINENEVRVSGTNVSGYAFANFYINDLVEVGKTYTISGSYRDVINANALTPCFDEYIGGTRTQANVRTITIQSNGSYRLKLYLNSGTSEALSGNSSVVYQNVKLEEGTTATSFSKYGLGGTQIITSNIDDSEAKQHLIPLQKEFCEIDGYKDTFVKENGKWYEKHYIRKIELAIKDMDNSEQYAGWKNVPQVKQDLPNHNGTLKSKTSYMSNIAGKNTEFVSINTLEYSNGVIFFVQTRTGLSQTDWKTLYPDLVFELYYLLKTPELIECNEEQCNILEQGLQIYDDITHIDAETNIKVKYMEKVEPFEINALESKSFEVGDIYEISRICYDDGTLKLQGGVNVISVDELPTEGIDTSSTYYLTKEMQYYNYINNEWVINQDIKNTLYLRINNLLITSQKEVDNIYETLKDFHIYNLKCENKMDISLDCWDLVTYITDKGQYTTFYNDDINFNGVTMGKTEVKVPLKTKEETTNIIQNNTSAKINRIKTILDEQQGTLSTVVSKTTEIDTKILETDTTVNNNYQDIIDKLGGYATTGAIVSVTEEVNRIQSSFNEKIEIIEKIDVDGVTKVKTETGFTFDKDGLTIEKTGAKTKSILDETGLEVMDNTSGTDEILLYAGVNEVTGEALVKSKNITVEKYLIVGRYTRFEDYTDANGAKWTGAFWIGG